MKKELLKIWQPHTNLKAKYPSQLILKNIIKHEDSFKLVIEDYENNITEVIYNQIKGNMEYYVWSFKYTQEVGRYGLFNLDVDKSNLQNTERAYFFKMENSDYIAWFDGQNPLFNSKTIPELVHHVYITRDEVVEVISEYEPYIECT